jgi:hypothetical protein
MKIKPNFDDFLVGTLSVPFLPELGTLGSPCKFFIFTQNTDNQQDKRLLRTWFKHRWDHQKKSLTICLSES